jgi:capsular polysaccharide biosynthesis protein
MLTTKRRTENTVELGLDDSPLVNTTRAAVAEFLGNIDEVRGSEILGWARRAGVAGPTLVDILIDGQIVATIAATLPRPDLKSANLGDGNHGFVFAIPPRFCDGQAHKIELKIAGTSFVLPRAAKVPAAVVLAGAPDHAPAMTMVKLEAARLDTAPRLFSPAAVSEQSVVTIAPEKKVEIPAPVNFDELSKTEALAKLFAAIPNYTFPALSCHGLRNAVLMKSGAVVVNGNEVLEESMEGEFSDNGFVKGGHGGFVIDQAKPGERLTQPIISIQKLGVFNYSLWLSEMLTRLQVVTRLHSLSDVQIVLSFPKFMSQKAIDLRFRTLEYLGVPRDRVIVSDAEHTRCDLLYFPRVNYRYRNHRIGQNLDEMTNMLRERIVGPAGTKPTDLLYVARSDASERRVVNEAELIKALEKFGFKSVLGSTMEFEDQVRTYARARLVFGAHGAGLANIAFAPRGTPVIEVFPEGFVGRWMYRMMAYAKGHPYFADKVDTGLCNKTERRDHLVDVDKCVRLVERAMKLAKL